MENNEEKSGITRIRVKNFRSIADSSLELGAATVLVGPNGSGKSNFLDAVAFLSDALRTNLDTAFSARQGFEAVRMREGKPGGVEMGVRYETDGLHIDYDFAVKGNDDGGCRVTRERVAFKTSDCERLPSIKIQNGILTSPTRLIKGIGERFETDNLAMPAIRSLIIRGALSSADRRLYDGFCALQRDLTGLRVYRLFPNAMRQPQKVKNPRPLEPDGGNLGSALRELGRKRPCSMERIKEEIHLAAPFITDLRVVSAGGFLITQLKHGDISVKDDEDAWFDLTQESDGTVRMLGIITALYQEPYLPLIGIEEPELNVHPRPLEALGEMMVIEAPRRSQVLTTTHTPDLINMFRVEDILVVNSEGGIASAGRVSDSQMKAVRKKLFSAGELHSMEGLNPAGAAR